MPKKYVRRVPEKRSVVRGKGRYRRTTNMLQIARNLTGRKVYTFAQMAYPPPGNWNLAGDGATPYVPQNNSCIRLINTSVTTGAPAAGFSIFGCFFTLNDVTDVSAYTALFDQYRIKGVIIEMICSGSESGIYNSTLTHVLNPFYFNSVLDYDDANVSGWTPTFLDQYQTNKDHIYGADAGKIYKRVLKPGTSQLVYKTSGSTIGYQQSKPGTWEDCNSSDIQHYGFKICIPGCGGIGNNMQQPAVDIRVKYILQFRNVR